MRRLWWVMGASAVGKKTLMRAALVDPSVRAALDLSGRVATVWMNDGTLEPHVRASVAHGEAEHTLLRWQFGREELLTEDWGHVTHAILLVVAAPSTHLARVTAREGDRWSAQRLADEAAEIRAMATRLARERRLDLRVVDVSEGYRLLGVAA